MPALLAIVLMLTALCLGSCGSAPTDIEETALNPNPDIVMKTALPVYDSGYAYAVLTIENHSDETIEFGATWHLEKKSGDAWNKMPFRENVAFHSILYSVSPGGIFGDTCSFFILKNDTLAKGDYRIIKYINDAPYAANFTVGASNASSKAPHGYAPLRSLPEKYEPQHAVTDGVVVLYDDHIENEEKMIEFFKFAHLPKWRGQLRIASFTVEGDMILTDIVRATDGRIDVHRDATRDDSGDDEITVSFFSSFISDGSTVFLSNHRIYGEQPENMPLIKGSKAAAELVKEYESSLYSISDLSVWSPDGSICASTASHDNCGFLLSTSSWGNTYSIKNENRTDSMQVVDLVWQDNQTLLLVAKTGDASSQYYYEFLKVSDNGETETLSYTHSNHTYTFHDGQIVIPE